MHDFPRILRPITVQQLAHSYCRPDSAMNNEEIENFNDRETLRYRRQEGGRYIWRVRRSAHTGKEFQDIRKKQQHRHLVQIQ